MWLPVILLPQQDQAEKQNQLLLALLTPEQRAAYDKARADADAREAARKARVHKRIIAAVLAFVLAFVLLCSVAYWMHLQQPEELDKPVTTQVAPAPASITVPHAELIKPPRD